MTDRQRLFDALDRVPVDRPPCASPLQTGTIDLMRLSGAWWPEANNVASSMARLAKAAHIHAGFEGVRVPFDITVDASAFGARTGLESVDRQPAVIGAVYPDAGMVPDIGIPDPVHDGRAPVLLEAIRTLRTDRDLDGIPVICGVVGPFMLACQLCGMERAMMDVQVDRPNLKRLLEAATVWCSSFIEEASRAGSDVIALIDATSSGDILAPEQYQDLAMPYQARVAETIKRSGPRSVLHICGDTGRNLIMMADCRFDGISVDQQMDIRSVRSVLKGRAACIGNVSPTSTLLMRNVNDVITETLDVMMKGTDVVAPGCGLAPRTPLANMRAMAETTIRHGADHWSSHQMG